MISQHGFLNLPKQSRSSAIYRIIPCDQFLDMLRNQKNWLAHPRKWDDPFENFILNSPIEVSEGSLAHSQARNDVYGQCWSLHKEADLMWRAYSPQKEAIKVQTTVELLLQFLFEACGQFKELSCLSARCDTLRRRR